jgi:hypothetical protein
MYILEFLDLCEECERLPDKHTKDLLPARSDDDAHCGAQDDAEWAAYYLSYQLVKGRDTTYAATSCERVGASGSGKRDS